MSRPHVVVVGAGFAGYQAARTLTRAARGRGARSSLVNPTDYFLYLPLLPEVAAGRPRAAPDHRLAERRRCPASGWCSARSTASTSAARRVGYTNPEGGRGALELRPARPRGRQRQQAAPDPGRRRARPRLPRHPEALYLRDHITRQIELADGDRRPGERDARSTFVVVGAGYTGTEVAAARRALHRRARPAAPGWLAASTARWMLLDLAERVLPELDPRLSAHGRPRAARARRRGPDPAPRSRRPTRDGVRLTDGEFVPTRSLIWCVGVRPDPLVDGLGLETERGRLVVDEYLTVPGHPEVFACGDAAAVPDLTRPGEITAMTAQHAAAPGPARRATMSPRRTGTAQPQPYKHHDLGSSSTSAGSTPPRTRCTAAVRAARQGGHPRLPPAVDAREPDPGGQPTGCSTPCCRGRPCSPGW